MALTKDITKLIDQSVLIAKNAADTATNSSITQDIRQKLIESSSKINDIVNTALANNGFVSKDDFNVLDEQMRVAKLSILQSQSNDSIKNYAVTGFILLAAFGILWFITKDK